MRTLPAAPYSRCCCRRCGTLLPQPLSPISLPLLLLAADACMPPFAYGLNIPNILLCIIHEQAYL